MQYTVVPDGLRALQTVVRKHRPSSRSSNKCAAPLRVSDDSTVYSVGLTFFRQQHRCEKLCAAEGICQIDTAPQSIEATFTGRHETFQYTKVFITLYYPSHQS
jgi:hypothetical protein